MYFDAFPKTTYNINGITENVIDIFRKIGISEDSKNKFFITELVQDTDTPETLAQKYYGDSNLSWVILITNNIINPYEEFVLSQKNLESLINTKYAGNILFFEEYVQLQQGDVLIKTTDAADTLPENLDETNLSSSDYAFVLSHDTEFRYTRIVDENGTIEAGTNLVAYRKIADRLTLITFNKEFTRGEGNTKSCVLPVKKKTKYTSAPVYLYDVTTQGLISPYKRSSGNDFIKINATGIFSHPSDANAFRSSLLFGIMDDTLNSDYAVMTAGEELRINNEKYREIKILPKEYVYNFIEAFNDLISREQPRFRIITSGN
jgi:hypothetical protein